MQTFNYNKPACQDGAKAFQDGRNLSENPYLFESQSRRRWIRGFNIQKTQNIIQSNEPKIEAVEPKPKKAVKKTVAKESISKRTVKKTSTK